MKISTYVNGIKRKFTGQTPWTSLKTYYKNFQKYSFIDCHCETPEQYEASITRLYHTIEKGLSYENYRAGFGASNVESLIVSLEQYSSKGYDTDKFFYKTALSCLEAYLLENKKYGYEDTVIENRINSLYGTANNAGGIRFVEKPSAPEKLNYKELVMQRHSIRHFSEIPIDIEKVKAAIELAQFTPSACNRQGWKTRIVSDKKILRAILANQNGNRGFGQEFDKLLIITADLRAQQKDREIFQAFIDGGMYAEGVVNSLYYYGIGSVPLSAALTPKQEKNIREVTRIDDAEVLILFVGIGNYPTDSFKTTKSERRDASIEII